MLYTILSSLGLYGFWLLTQAYLAADTSDEVLIDRIHNSQLVNATVAYLYHNPSIASFHIALTTLLLDVTITGVMVASILTGKPKPIIMMILGVFLRQVNQAMTKLPTPEGMVWFDPGFPTLYMIYEAQNDFFFSGHTLTSLITGGYLLESNNFALKIYGVIYIAYEITFVLLTRAHYFMDVYAAVSTYFMLRWIVDRMV